MQNFTALGLPRPLLQALEKMKFEKPTPIQAQAIPPALEGRDVLGSAQTGTGKTAAFVIPMLTHLLQPADPHHRSPSMAIVMTPTRELAMQVFDAVKTLLAYAPPHLRAALLIGGQSMGGQLRQLRDRPRIIIGTPGRINDHLQQRTLFLATADFLVLDETDRMLDMGFGPQIDRIVKTMPKKRQTLLFSATLPPHIVKVSEQYLHQPVRVAVGPVNQAVPKIRQELVHLQIAEKFDRLVKEISTRSGSIIVFVKTKRGADRIADKLNKSDLGAVAIHGNLNQNQRNRVIQSFRDMKHRVLIATDVASRGLDIPHIEHVVNYDLPQVAEDYIHRIGRTARAGKEGDAVCFITPEDSEMWREIHKLLHPNAAPLPPSDRKPIKKGGGGQHRTRTPEEKARIGRNRTGFEHRKARKGGADVNDGNRRNAGGDRPQRDDRPPREERPYRGDRPQGQRNDRPQGQRNDRPQGRRDDRPRFDRGQGYAGGRDSDYFEPRGERSSRDHDDNPRQYRNDRRHERGARSGETVGAGASQRDDRGGYGKKPRGSFESRGARQGDRQRGSGFGGGSRDGQRGGYSANNRSGGRSGDSRGGFRKGSGGGRKRDTRG